MINRLIEGIQSGDLTHNKILELANKSRTEYDELVGYAEHLDGRNTLLELMLQSANKRADEAQNTLTEIEGSMDQLKANIQKMGDTSVAQNSEIIRLRQESKTSKANAKEIKALKANKAKMVKKSTEREKRIQTLTDAGKEYRKELGTKDREIARLRLTGQKIIGDFRFTLFPSKIEATDKGVKTQRVGLVAFTEAGTMKVVRATEDGEIIQPKDSEPFIFCEESKEFIRGFCAVAMADGDQFTDRVLMMVN